MVLQIMVVVLAGAVLQRVPDYPPIVEDAWPPELYVTSGARKILRCMDCYLRSQQRS